MAKPEGISKQLFCYFSGYTKKNKKNINFYSKIWIRTCSLCEQFFGFAKGTTNLKLFLALPTIGPPYIVGSTASYASRPNFLKK
jgi:hypothetical protein